MWQISKIWISGERGVRFVRVMWSISFGIKNIKAQQNILEGNNIKGLILIWHNT